MSRRGGGGIHAPLDCYSVYVGNIYGFVNFEKAQDAASASVTMNGEQIGGKTLQVNYNPANTDLQCAQEILGTQKQY